MGEIRRFKSDCGYSEDIFYGVGINAIDERQVESRFPESYKTIKAGMLSGKILSTMVSTETGICLKCRKIVPLNVLDITCSDGSGFKITGKCPDCGEACNIVDVDKPIICPKCGNPMENEIVGNWD